MMNEQGFRLGTAVVGCIAVLMLLAPVAHADSTTREPAVQEAAGSFLKELGAAMTQEMTKKGRQRSQGCAQLAPEIVNGCRGNMAGASPAWGYECATHWSACLMRGSSKSWPSSLSGREKGRRSSA